MCDFENGSIKMKGSSEAKGDAATAIGLDGRFKVRQEEGILKHNKRRKLPFTEAVV